MKTYILKNLSKKEIEELTYRPSFNEKNIRKIVENILIDVKNNGIVAALKYEMKFNPSIKDLKVSEDEIIESEKFVPNKIKSAIKTAIRNVKKFHREQIPKSYNIEIDDGIICERKFFPIENVGLYIPGGTAVLPSTLIMLAIPASIAKCKRIVVSSPSQNGKISEVLLYTAKILGIKEFYKIGGAQAIALMAFGAKEFPKVDKIFGPGNRYVTLAKEMVSIDNKGATIDMPAGPSEVLIIADETANAEFVAADLLSQAEHGEDSQVILITTNIKFAEQVKIILKKQINVLERKFIAEKSINNSFILVVKNIDEAVELSNKYAPEHLILCVKNEKKYVNKIKNAGSVFIGNYSPESAGDYASGTNHTLPTNGYAKSYSGLGVESFMKSITFQKLTKRGLEKISASVITLAEEEKLQGHSNAVKVRLGK